MLKKVNKITENITTEDIENAIKEANKKYIPVSLVEEKIEEYKKFLKTKNLHRWERLIANNIIDVLQELLEKR